VDELHVVCIRLWQRRRTVPDRDIVQMVGVVILTFGLPPSFSAAADGQSPNNVLMVVGYIVMRVPLILLWLRAAQHDRSHRRVAVVYAVMIAVAQTGWLLTAIAALPVTATLIARSGGDGGSCSGGAETGEGALECRPYR
jgi:low temperature requirement protein LtrA